MLTELGYRVIEVESAREALRRKADHEQIAIGYKKQWDAQQASTENLKNALRALSQKIEEAGRKKNLLVARQKRAEAQKHIHEVMTGLTDTSAFESFDRMASKVNASKWATLHALTVLKHAFPENGA